MIDLKVFTCALESGWLEQGPFGSGGDFLMVLTRIVDAVRFKRWPTSHDALTFLTPARLRI